MNPAPKPKILAIDDDPLFQKALETVLSRLGVEIRVTGDPYKFLSLAQALPADVYLIDLQLNQFSGIDLIPTIRKMNPDATIIVISGDQQQATLIHALELGATDFILKPLDRVLLASKLSTYLTTEPLKEMGSDSVKLDDQEISLKLSFDVALFSVDELGVHLSCDHIIPKGTTVRIKSDFFTQIGSASNEVLVTILSTSVDYNTNLYQSYAEFDDSAGELMENIRRWIVTRHQL